MAGRDDLGSFESLRRREATLARKRYAEIMHTKTYPDYAGFVRQSSGLNLNDFSADAEAKEDLLRKFFPGRYRTHHWDEMDNAQKGALYKKLYEYSIKHQH